MKNNRLQGIIGTVVVHLIILLILFVVTLHAATPEEESGVPVMLGSAELSQGDADPYTLTEVDVLDELQPETAPADPSVETPSEQEMLTQDLEETVAMKPQKKPVKPKTEVKTPPKKQPEQPKQPTKTPEQIAAEKRAAAEKAAAEEAAKKIAGAFGKGSSMGNRGTGTTGSGVQGSSTGNSNTGKSTGVGGVGSWDLNGRSLTGSLPIPVYNVQDEGRVVVTIVVNPSGRVISTSINKRTNTVSTALRRAAEEAARKARFNVTDGVNNQTGTITYYFKLR
ncbi:MULTISPECIES: TonB family protein [Mediterranea]|mgnify:FL=1|uniref:TonB family protein n=1 Tax=Mediterranea TaxID=1926659 RepID=UPI002012DAC5|nr:MULTISPECIES: TonB family protein [Mediterranea]MCL1608651.1 TonB family protein [Mediterranea sp. ET5]MDM8123727.1 TonB family protein [Mediterranea massiliensis]MDM8199396.1 TonB family protein [Mediterranea massiliensis]